MPLVRRIGASILINGVAPYVIYFVLHHQFRLAELPALLATSNPPLLDALVGIVRWRRIDLLAGFVLIDWDEQQVEGGDVDVALPLNAAGFDGDAYDMAAQASAASDAAVGWDDAQAVERLAEVRAV